VPPSCRCRIEGSRRATGAADAEGRKLALHYLRTKDGREVDFAVIERGRRPLLFEVRHADQSPGASLAHFAAFLPGCSRLQLVREIRRESTYPDGTEVRRAATWLASLSL
jgi:hypothetical protein